MFCFVLFSHLVLLFVYPGFVSCCLMFSICLHCFCMCGSSLTKSGFCVSLGSTFDKFYVLFGPFGSILGPFWGTFHARGIHLGVPWAPLGGPGSQVPLAAVFWSFLELASRSSWSSWSTRSRRSGVKKCSWEPHFLAPGARMT